MGEFLLNPKTGQGLPGQERGKARYFFPLSAGNRPKVIQFNIFNILPHTEQKKAVSVTALFPLNNYEKKICGILLYNTHFLTKIFVK